MSDEIKTEAEKVLSDAKVDLSATEGYVKTHMVVIAAILGALLGFILGKVV